MDKDCKCEKCQLLKKGFTEREIEIMQREKMELFMEQYGFYCDSVSHGDHAEIHTHGLPLSFNHMDLQIVLPMPSDVAMGIIHNVVNKIRKGHIYKDGDIETEEILASGYPIKFKESREDDRMVLRILIPDENKKLPGDKDCKKYYALQLLF